jgi:hypothetical protein
MVKFKQIIYVIVFILTGHATLYAIDLKDGILGIRWETNIADIEDLVKVAEKDDVAYYKNSKRTYTVFHIETPYVVFGFYRDALFAAYVQVESIQVYNRTIELLTEKFGPPQKILKVIEQETIYRWKNENTKIKLKLQEKEGKMKLGFYYTPLSVKVNEAQQAVFPELPKPSVQSDERKLREAMEVMEF